jgi:hypothetical protein
MHIAKAGLGLAHGQILSGPRVLFLSDVNRAVHTLRDLRGPVDLAGQCQHHRGAGGLGGQVQRRRRRRMFVKDYGTAGPRGGERYPGAGKLLIVSSL